MLNFGLEKNSEVLIKMMNSYYQQPLSQKWSEEQRDALRWLTFSFRNLADSGDKYADATANVNLSVLQQLIARDEMMEVGMEIPVVMGMQRRDVSYETLFTEGLLWHFQMIVHRTHFTLDESFRPVPAQEAIIEDYDFENLRIKHGTRQSRSDSEWLIVKALSLVQSLFADEKRNRKRLKLCPFCSLLFWDRTTKASTRTACYEIQCSKRWAVQRSTASRKNKKNKEAMRNIRKTKSKQGR